MKTLSALVCLLSIGSTVLAADLKDLVVEIPTGYIQVALICQIDPTTSKMTSTLDEVDLGSQQNIKFPTESFAPVSNMYIRDDRELVARDTDGEMPMGDLTTDGRNGPTTTQQLCNNELATTMATLEAQIALSAQNPQRVQQLKLAEQNIQSGKQVMIAQSILMMGPQAPVRVERQLGKILSSEAGKCQRERTRKVTVGHGSKGASEVVAFEVKDIALDACGIN